MPKVMNVPDGTYGVPDPDRPHVMTLWWIHKGNMTAWPKGVRYAPSLPGRPAGMSMAERRVWRDDWYANVYFVWRDEVIAAIVADLGTARVNFAEHVAEEDRPVIPVRVDKREVDKRRAEEVQAAFLYDVRGKSLDDVVAALRLPQTTTWRRIEDGRVLLAQVQEAVDRVNAATERSPWLVAADLMDAQSGELPHANP